MTETTTSQPVPTPRPAPILRWVTIREKEEVTPHVLRLKLQGEGLAGFTMRGPGCHIKLMLPPPGETKPTPPLRYEDRRPIYPEGASIPFTRTYTPLNFDPEKLEMEVEFLVHGGGAASDWAANAEVGHEIVVLGPGGGWDVPQDGEWYVLAADESSIPAAGQVLEALPRPPHAIFVEVASESEKRELPFVDPSIVQWLYRGEDTQKAGEAIEAAIKELELPARKGYIWVACESGAMRRIRKYLIDEKGLPTEQMVTRGYWKLGAQNHPDGDYGQEMGQR
jgi:NADPH-dependent ferric siderophore reductase